MSPQGQFETYGLDLSSDGFAPKATVQGVSQIDPSG
jgi:hypothetical protein